MSGTTEISNTAFLRLPFPPSINAYHRHIVLRGTPRTLVSAAGRKYQNDVMFAVLACEPKRAAMLGRLSVTITLRMPDKRRRDVDNYCKALLDSLTKAKLWEDDSQIDELYIQRHGIVKGGEAVVFVKEHALTQL